MSLGSVAFLACCLLSECLKTVEATEILYSVDEEVPVGTRIGNVATDSRVGDGTPREVRQSLRFKFLSNPSLNITIDDQTGDIRTTGRIDRDALCRGVGIGVGGVGGSGGGGGGDEDDAAVCQVRLNVAVHPVAYFQIIKLVITVNDVNDNSPEFRPNRMVHEMIESTALESSFVVPTARDADSGANAVRRYELVDPDRFFLLNITRKLDGSSEIRLALARSLDRETKEEHRVTVVAYDAGRPARSGSVDVTVVVLDSNDNSPAFEYASYAVTIDENAPLGSTVTKVTAHDGDIDLNAQVLYFLSASTQTAFGSIFSVNNITGEILVVGNVDYERAATYHLIVSAVDRGLDPIPSETNVIVKVEDVNDNAPKITVNTLFASDTNVSDVLESAHNNTFVGHVIVHDPDRGRNGRLNCSISDATHFRLQWVLGGEYHVITVTELDFEAKSRYSVKIRCWDHGKPSLESERDMTVNVLDVNDNDPECSPDVYRAEVFENNYNGKVVVQVNCTDADSAQYSITSYRVSEDAVGTFAVDDTSGTVTATSSLDRELTGEHRFFVFAVDGGVPARTGTATVVVTVLDVNDQRPLFSADSFEFEVEENLPAGSFVGELSARDLDSHPFDIFQFSLGPGSTVVSSDAFLVNRVTGKLTTTRALDREDQAVYRMTSIVSDVTNPAMTSSADVTVVVLDANDHSPVFVFPTAGNNTVQVSGDALEGQALACVHAHDPDDRLNGEVVYLVVKGDDLKVFHLDPVTGVLKANVDFEQVGNDTFSLVVSAEDRAAVPRRSLSLLSVVVQRGGGEQRRRRNGFQAFISFDRNSLVPILIVSGVSAVIISVLLVAIFVVVCQQRARGKDNERKYNCRTGEGAPPKAKKTLAVEGEGDRAGVASPPVGKVCASSAIVDPQAKNSTVHVRFENGKTVSQCCQGTQEKQPGRHGNLRPPDYYECYSDYSSAESLAPAATLSRGYHVICDVGDVTPIFDGHRTKQLMPSEDPDGTKSRAHNNNVFGNTLRSRLRSCDGELSVDVSSADSGSHSNFNEESRDNMSAALLMSRRSSEMAAKPFASVRRNNHCPYSQTSQGTKYPGTTLPRASSTTTALAPCYGDVSSFQVNHRAAAAAAENESDLVCSGTAYEVSPSSSFQRFYFRPDGVRDQQDGGRKYGSNHVITSGSQMNKIGSLGDSCL